MSKVFDSGFLAGDWVVQPELNSLSKDGLEHHVEPKVMSVLLVLAEHPNHVVAKEDLIAAVWQGTFVGDDVLTRCISILRRITEDDPHSPHFIQTVPKVGYRLVAPVSLPAADATTGSAPSFEPAPPQPSIIAGPAPGPQSKRPLPARSWTLAALAILILGSLAAAWRYRQTTIKSTDVLGASRVVQFTSSAGEQTQPTFSPDGSHIAFVQTSEAGSSRQIYIKKIGSETMLPLVPGADAQFSPAWSPTGKQIAYLSRSPNGLGLYVVDIGADFRASGAAARCLSRSNPAIGSRAHSPGLQMPEASSFRTIAAPNRTLPSSSSTCRVLTLTPSLRLRPGGRAT